MTAKSNTDKPRKWLLWISGFAAVLAIGIVAMYYYSASRDFYFNEIKELVKTKTGYSLHKDGSLEFTVFPRPKLTARRIKVENPQVGDDALLVDAARLSLILHWGPLLQLQLKLDGELESPQFTLSVDSQGQESWLTEELSTVSGELPFELVGIDAWETQFLFRNHQRNEILGFDLQKFDLDLATGKASSRIETAGRFGHSRFFAVGDAEYLGIENKLTVNLDIGAGPAQDIRVSAVKAVSVTDWIRQNAPAFPLQGTIRGEVVLEEGLPHGKLDFAARLSALNELDYLIDELAYLRPDIGPVSTSGILSLNGSDLDLQGLNVRLLGDSANLELTGDVHNLLSEIEIKLETNGQVDDLKVLMDVGVDLSPLGPIAFESQIAGKQGSYEIDGLKVALQDNNITSSLNGELQLVDRRVGYSLDSSLEIRDAALFQALLSKLPEPFPQPAFDLGPLGPVAIKTRITGEQDKHMIDALEARLQGDNVTSTVKGEVRLLGEDVQLDLDSRLDIKDAERLDMYLPELPEPVLNKLEVGIDATIKGNLGDFAIQGIDLSVSRDDRKLVAQGSVSRLPSGIASDIDFHYVTRNPIQLEEYFSKLESLQIAGPLDLVGTLRIKNNVANIGNLALQAERTDLGGHIRIDMNASPPRIFAVFDSSQLYTNLISADPEQVAGQDETGGKIVEQPEPIAEAKAEQMEKSFSKYLAGVKIETDWIRDLHLYFSLDADRAVLGEYELENLRIAIDIANGVFTLSEYELMLDGRPLSIRGLIDINTDEPTYYFSGEMEGGTLEALLNLEEDIFIGGRLSGDFRLQSKGSTLGKVIEHANGEALITMGPLDIRSNALTLFSSDIVTSMLRGIISPRKDQKTSSYNCAVLGVEVRNGVALMNNSFAMESRRYNLAGRGEVDLNTGYVDLSVRPRARKGLGVSLSTLVGGFRIKGHMATPNFGVSGGSLVTAAVAGYALTPTMAAMTTNPATATILATGFVAKGIFDRLTASNFSCDNTLKRIQRNRERMNRTRSRNPHSGKMNLR